MGTTIAISAACLVIGFAAASWNLSRRLTSVQKELQIAQEQVATTKQPEVRNLLQEISEVALRMDGDVGRHTRRLTEVNQDLQHAAEGDIAPIVTMTQQLLEANKTLRSELQTARQELSAKQQLLETFVSEARTDILTGLRNRRSFNEELDRHFAQRQRQGILFSLIMIDIDHFKKFNDSHGHLSGDLVLRVVADVLSSTLREMDVPCRYGGEEFAVICPGSTLCEAAVGAERVRQAIAERTVSLKEGNVQVTVSAGVAEVAESEVAEGLIQRADDGLYSAKRAGRNCIHLHDGHECVPSVADGTRS